MTISLGKDTVRADFEKKEFDREIRAHGYRCLWSAAELCPCRLNEKTGQPDPTCDYCTGTGFFYTFPDPDGETIAEYLTETPPFLDTTEARATQAIVTSMARNPLIYERLGEWVTGSAALTTFSFNKLGNRDRFKFVDSTMLYRQVLKVPADKTFRIGSRDSTKQLRYPAVKIRRVFMIPADGAAPVDLTADSEIDASGRIVVDATSGTRVSLSYEFHPVWTVIDFPMSVRSTLIKHKTASKIGEFENLPIHALVRLDFLVDTLNPSPA